MNPISNEAEDFSEQDVAYWHWQLKTYLQKANRSFLLLMSAKGKAENFLDQRAKEASHAYLEAIEAKASHEGALEMGKAVLFRDVSFSRSEHLEYLIVTHYPEEYRKVNEQQWEAMLHQLVIYTDSAYNKFLTPELSGSSMDAVDRALLPHIALFMLQHRDLYMATT